MFSLPEDSQDMIGTRRDLNPVTVLKGIENSRVRAVDDFIMSSDIPVGYNTFLFEQGLGGKNHPAGVDTSVYQSQRADIDKNEEMWMEYSRRQHGERDGNNSGRYERDPVIIREIGYSNEGAQTDVAGPPMAMQRSLVQAYARKHGFHQGWNPFATVQGEVEASQGELRISSALQDGVDQGEGVYVNGEWLTTEMLAADEISFGMDGLQKHGYQLPNGDQIMKRDAFHRRIGADDVGFDHGGHFRAGHKRMNFHTTLAQTAGDADKKVDQADPHYTQSEQESVAQQPHEPTSNQNHRLAQGEGGSRNLPNRGATGGWIEAEVAKIL
tara:strand:+ start:3855 stop:4832 length:978 start_codon:yes stop_codon:yes gene_type:complete